MIATTRSGSHETTPLSDRSMSSGSLSYLAHQHPRLGMARYCDIMKWWLRRVLAVVTRVVPRIGGLAPQLSIGYQGVSSITYASVFLVWYRKRPFLSRVASHRDHSSTAAIHPGKLSHNIAERIRLISLSVRQPPDCHRHHPAFSPHGSVNY